VRKVADSNRRDAQRAVHRFQRCSSTSRSPSTSGETGTRTPDTLRCYTLSRRAPRPAGLSPWSGWPDSNRRPRGPEPRALTKLRHNPVGMAGVEPAASEPPARRATAAPHPGTYPRRESNPDPRLRRPVSCPLDHKGMVPSAGVEPATTVVSERCPYHSGLDGLAESARFELARVSSRRRLSGPQPYQISQLSNVRARRRRGSNPRPLP
jgi:hypothetical protein